MHFISVIKTFLFILGISLETFFYTITVVRYLKTFFITQTFSLLPKTNNNNKTYLCHFYPLPLGILF
jgi:hypothetical protein